MGAGEESTTSVMATQLLRRRQRIHSIASMDSLIGEQVGRWPRKRGAAASMERAAPITAADASPHRSHLIAMQGLPIGSADGPSRRRSGVARTRAGDANRHQADALESPPPTCQSFEAKAGIICRHFAMRDTAEAEVE